jgi:mRNA interferase HigB
MDPEDRLLHVISRRKLLEAAAQSGDLASPLDVWYRIAKKSEWKSLEDVRKMFPSADGVGKHTVFNIKGNHYRLITEINYPIGRLYIRHVLTHAEYSKGGWKQ